MKEFLNKNKALLIGGLIFWILGIIFLVAPFTYTIQESTTNGAFSLEVFLENIFQNISSLNGISKCLSTEGVGTIFFKHSFLFTLIVMLLVGIGLFKSRKKSEYDKIEHGSSDWSQNGEQYRVLSKNSGLILAEDNYLPLNKLGNINVLIVGGSGSGKSASYSIPNAHLGLGSYVFTDPKGEIYDKTAGYLKKIGYEIKLLNLVNPESSDSYNPLFHVQSQLDVDIIASTIVKGQKREGSTQDPYWDNMSELLLKALIYLLLATRPPEEQNLASCAELVRAANQNGDSNLLTNLMEQLPYDHPARMNYKSVEIAPAKTMSTILSSLQSSLGKFDSQEIADVTSTNTIDFEELAMKKTALYVVSSDTHTAYDFLLTIFFSQMIQQLYDFADKRGGKLPVPLFFILDEFANIGQIPDFDKKISTSRSRGISFSVILQNLDQLKNIYEKSYETIIGNCDTHVFLGSNSYETVEYFSKELGEKTISYDSKSTSRDRDARRTGTSNSDQIMARALMTPDELRRMDNNNCIIFEKGLKPIKANKFWWFKKQNIVRDLNGNQISHNDYKVEARGNWRKFNPYNPYKEDEEKEKEDSAISSLDDLFVDEDNNANVVNNNNSNNNVNNNNINNNMNNSFNNNNNVQDSYNNNIQNQQNSFNIGTNSDKIENNAMNANYNNSNDEKPQVNDDNDIDIEKELEAKFDELFGNSENKEIKNDSNSNNRMMNNNISNNSIIIGNNNRKMNQNQ